MAFERGRMHKCTSPTGRLGATAKFNRDSASSAGASGCPKHDLRVGPPMLLPEWLPTWLLSPKEPWSKEPSHS